jgi:hypothetical protein
MGRKYQDGVTGATISLLDKLINEQTNSNEYAHAMYELGKVFGSILLSSIGNAETVALASTVEDADFLGKGIIDALENNGKKVLLTVFWNKRFKPNSENNLSIAPILREFHQQSDNKPDVLIVIKSIIANSCVVRTNLTKLIEESDPDKIFIVAPVLLEGAIKNLENEFDEKISKRFSYLYFAVDNEKSKEGMVLPGIGGDVYQRLGFKNQDTKNQFTPRIVKERRSIAIG